jgi:hypothetical protein
MKINLNKKLAYPVITGAVLLGSMVPMTSAMAATAGTTNASTTTTTTSPAGTNSTSGSTSTSSSSSSSNSTTRLQNIISKGDQEITRRLTSLNEASTKISSNTKLNASDKSYLSTEVSTEITGLTSLKTKLDADTTVSTAGADAKSIYDDYRVYALVLPKIWLVKTADDQQVVQDKLSALSAKLQTRINNAKAKNKDVAQLQTELNDLNTNVTNARNISSSMEQKVLTLQPSDYNSDHALLTGDKAQLQQAHTDNVAAWNDAKNIVQTLKADNL